MGRILEFLFIAIIIYLAYRRIADPLRRGYNDRERERRASTFGWGKKDTPRIDRSNAKDAEFKDIS
jgi:hypothetical protein